MAPPLEVFCCYAREDQTMLEQLRKHLTPLQRQGQITIWSDTDLSAGVEWEKELHLHLESADLILLLISPDFMSSDYCYSTEMKRAIERHDQGSAQVIPILLRSTFWQSAPFAKLQMLPTNATPITNWLDRDKAFHDITEQVYRVISELQKQRALDKANKLALQKTPLGNVGNQNSISPFIAKPDAMKVLHTFRCPIGVMALSADGRMLAIDNNRDGTIFLLDVQKEETLHTLISHIDTMESITLSADGRTLAGSSFEIIKLWNAQTGHPIRTIADFAGDIALSADGRTLASGSLDGTIKLWDVQTGRILHTLTSHKKVVGCIVLSADGRTLVSRGLDNTSKIWDVQKGKLLRTLINPTPLPGFIAQKKPRNEAWQNTTGSMEDIALSADGRTLAIVSSYGLVHLERDVKIWDVWKGKLLRTLDSTFYSESSIALSADGQVLAWGNDRGDVLLWDVQTGRSLRTLTDCRTSIKNVAFSTNGLLAYSTFDTIKVWGVEE